MAQIMAGSSTGGKALAIPFVDGYSTAALVTKIRRPII
jgi:bifunctional ADP-heptose synthase (sugar kinase/adenylyltransferase)